MLKHPNILKGFHGYCNFFPPRYNRPMDNKRKFVRFAAPLYVKYNIDDEPRQLSGVVHNVSMGGAMVMAEEDTQVKAKNTVQLYFLLPENTLAIQGKVTWVKNSAEGKEFGIIFNEFPDACKEVLYQHIFKHHRDEITNKWWQV